MKSVSNKEVKSFWNQNPVGAEVISAAIGTPEFFTNFDSIREQDECEPYFISDEIHGYSSSEGKLVLDVGCGNGYVLSRYAMQGANVNGVDITDTAINLSKKRFDLAGLSGDFQTTNGERLPFPDNHFDIVCSMGVLHHIDNPDPMIKEMYRVLKPGGKLVIMLYYRYSWKTVVVLRLRRLLEPKYWGKSQQEALNMNDGDDCPLARVFSKSEARNKFSRFDRHTFRLTQLSWKQLFLLPPLARLLKPVLPCSCNSIFARFMGWNMNIEAYKPINSNGDRDGVRE